LSAAQKPVKEMFGNLSQQELVQAMEEGQQFIEHLEKHGTEEEKKAFAQAMEDTMKGFTEDDWKEFEQIVDTIQDQLPESMLEPEDPIIQPADKVEQAPKAKEVTSAPIDNSFEKVLHSINKVINSVFIKAKSDKDLTQVMMNWTQKDQFIEMARLIQVLNKKELIIKITTSKDEDIKMLLQSIESFNKLLIEENKKFIIADTFGLPTEVSVSKENTEKLIKIINFFNKATESLNDKLAKFIIAYEPEALKIAKDNDDLAKESLEGATKIEKMKRPANASPSSQGQYQDNSYQSNQPARSRNYNPGGGYNDHNYSTAQDRRNQNRMNNDSKPAAQQPTQPKKGDNKEKEATNKENLDKEKADKDKAAKENPYNIAIRSIDGYLDMFSQNDVTQYNNIVSKIAGTYQSFPAPIKPINETSFIGPLESTDPEYKKRDLINKKIEQQNIELNKNIDQLKDNIQRANEHYGNAKTDVDDISAQINEVTKVIDTVRGQTDKMTAAELNKLLMSPELKTLGNRVDSYYSIVKNAQSAIHNKHKFYRLDQANSSDLARYDQLESKVLSFHGLESKASNVKLQLDTLHRYIKKELKQRKRESNTSN